MGFHPTATLAIFGATAAVARLYSLNAEQTARVRIARDELRRIRELTRAINELHAELGQ